MTSPRRKATDLLGIAAASILAGWMLSNCVPSGLPVMQHVPLLGAHSDLGCVDCHADSLTAPVPDTCRGCHEEDAPQPHYDGDCGTCHTNVDWADVEVRHEFFPLVGGHDQPQCTACHAVDTYLGLDPACSSCHELDRPDEAHYPGQDCVSCHTIFDWDDASIDHSFFPLEAGHSGQSCETCHGDGVFEGTSPACTSCHAADEPRNHFDGECSNCHNIRTWGDADFDHGRYFPLPHRGVRQCTSCHLDESDYSQFSCTDCHEHRRSSMDSEHRGNRNYRWESSACLDCHPRGRE